MGDFQVLLYNYILKEQSFSYTIMKIGSIKRILSSDVCNFPRSIFVGLMLVASIKCVISFP